MTIKDALRKGIDILKQANIEAPAVEAGVILCHTLDCDKAFLYAHGDKVPEDRQLEDFFERVARRAAGVPVQYITGCQEFMSLNFAVGPQVLIPRQDTEILVETVMEHMKKLAAEPFEVLDIGTGSGCIAVSFAYYMKNCRVTAVDVSEGALETARLNAVRAGVGCRVDFVRSNLFERLENRTFDVIVSNPPYIPAGDIEGLQAEVKDHEPRAALDGGVDGLDFYRAIVRDSVNFLKPEGLLAFEVGWGQAEDVCRLMREKYSDICVNKDLAGIERVVTGRYHAD